MNDPIREIRVAVAACLRKYQVNCSHKEFVDDVVDRISDEFRSSSADAEAVSMIRELANEHHDRVFGLCPNGQSRWDVIDVLQRPYKEDSPDSAWLVGRGETAIDAVHAAGRSC